MPAAPATAPVLLVCGEDDFNVKQRARQVFQKWSEELGGMDHETVDAQAGNGADALKSIGRLREALNTLPFFGGGKAVWWQNCSFLGDDRTAGSQAVTEALAELSTDLKKFPWQNVRLLISAGKVDKRKTFYKTIEKLGAVESFAALSIEDKDWASQAEDHALKQLRALKKSIDDEALGELVNNVGPNLRQLTSEVEKLALYTGDRDLPRLLRCLDEEMWEMQFNRDKSEIGLLYGLISKIRALIFLKEMLREKWVQPDADYNRFKSQLDRIPKERLPEDKRFNPLALNPFVLFKALPHARRYSSDELVRAMELLLQCNHRLITSALDEKLVLQQTLVEIVRSKTAPVNTARG
jgi:DNA polymerase III subunit delta